MISLSLRPRGDAPLRVLCLGAHSDDIEIGCGATLLRLQREYPSVEFHWIVFGAEGVRAHEAQASAQAFLATAGARAIELHAYANSFFPYHGERIKQVFESLKSRVDPDVVFTHARDDAHQDHRVVCELTWNTFRDHLILEYEIPKYDGDLGRPNVFVPVDQAVCDQKVHLLISNFASQRDRSWFTEDTFRALLRLRGMECNSASRFAEAFHCRKLVL